MFFVLKVERDQKGERERATIFVQWKTNVLVLPLDIGIMFFYKFQGQKEVMEREKQCSFERDREAIVSYYQ